jgi:hypothetical protein
VKFQYPKPLHRAPLVAPAGLPLPGPLGQAQDAPGTPQVRIRSLTHNLNGAQRIRLVVHEPTLVKLVSLELDTPASTASIAANWQLLDDNNSAAAFYALIPFFGPWAWFEVPGIYELRVIVNTASVAQLLTFAIYTGLDQRTLDLMLQPDRVHYWQSEVTTLVAATVTPIWSEPELFPSYKHLIVRNISAAGVTTINFNGSAFPLALGSSGTTGLGGPGAGTFTIPPDFLGRATITAVSAGGGDIAVCISQW